MFVENKNENENWVERMSERGLCMNNLIGFCGSITNYTLTTSLKYMKNVSFIGRSVDIFSIKQNFRSTT